MNSARLKQIENNPVGETVELSNLQLQIVKTPAAYGFADEKEVYAEVYHLQ
jgi:hypothetical protein